MKPRILYLPIFEEGQNHALQVKTKHGLLDALKEQAEVMQVDYLDIPLDLLFDEVMERIYKFCPDLLLTQLHGVDRLTAENMRQIRTEYPALAIANWSGDSWHHSLTSPEMLELCGTFDLQLIAAPDELDVYAEHGIKAKFWQIGYEEPIGPLPDMPTYDVVYLGNIISDKRRAFLEWLRTLEGYSVGIYGDWEKADGKNTYDFAAGEALYKNAKVAIADFAYPDQTNYVSNRPIQILMAGGAILLHERVPKMWEMMGWQKHIHYEEWEDFDSLLYLIQTYAKGSESDEKRRQRIVKQGQSQAKRMHTYRRRVVELFQYLAEIPQFERFAKEEETDDNDKI